MKNHGPSNHERGRNAPTVRNWRSNLVAIVVLGVAVLLILFYLIRSAF